MKKVLLLLVILILLVVGCNSTPEAEEETKEIVEDLPEEPKQPEIEEELEEEPVVEAGAIPSIIEWCVTGFTYNLNSEGNSVDSKIVGIEIYKEKEFCKGEQTTNIQGMDIITTYYFTYEGQEMWVVSSVAGTTVETHIMDGEIVA